MGGWVEGDPVGDRVFLDLPEPFPLERGGVLPSVRVAYETWGTLAADGGNAVLVEHVVWASLPDSPFHDLAEKYTPRGAGAVLSFEIVGGLESGKRFVEALSLHSHVANIGDVRSLVIHPASTTHSQLTAEEQLTTGVTPGLVRLAVGLEGIEDILADLEAGFRAAKGA